jgi:hypothetical protein
MIEKGVLEILRSFGCHCRVPLFIARGPHRETIIHKSQPLVERARDLGQ